MNTRQPVVCAIENILFRHSGEEKGVVSSNWGESGRLSEVMKSDWWVYLCAARRSWSGGSFRDEGQLWTGSFWKLVRRNGQSLAAGRFVKR